MLAVEVFEIRMPISPKRPINAAHEGSFHRCIGFLMPRRKRSNIGKKKREPGEPDSLISCDPPPERRVIRLTGPNPGRR
jgi:hypothetical protein